MLRFSYYTFFITKCNVLFYYLEEFWIKTHTQETGIFCQHVTQIPKCWQVCLILLNNFYFTLYCLYYSHYWHYLVTVIFQSQRRCCACSLLLILCCNYCI